jgi:UDPglucose--hexose-1-phosphate uridylyltransferase
MLDIENNTHNRFNPLTKEWVKCSPHRAKRPWQGQVEAPQKDDRPHHDEKCYLCAGNKRTSGITNPQYESTYVFQNDFSAILPEGSNESFAKGPNNMLEAKGERGICKVICFSPRHDLTISRMTLSNIEKIINVWREQYIELGKKDFIKHVQIFENRGSVMGCSNPHPHGQIWSEEVIPEITITECKNQMAYYEEHNSSMLLDYAKYELEAKERLIVTDEHFIAVVPFWAVWPYEAMILPANREIGSLDELTNEEEKSLAKVMKTLGIRYDNLFKTSFPYSMGIHQRPTDGKKYAGCLMHFHYYPPLLRSASVKKFMVGYELMSMPQRDITAESAAKNLRELSEIHYLEEMEK